MVSYIQLFLLLALRVAADTIQPTNEKPEEEAVQLALQWAPNDASSMLFNIEPLTTGAGMGASANLLQLNHQKGLLTIPTDSGNSTTDQDIAFLSCDNDNSSNLSPGDVFTIVASKHPQAIILYSLVDNSCTLTETTSNYTDVFTMIGSNNSNTLFVNLNKTIDTPSMAHIISNATPTSDTASPSASAAASQGDSGGTPAPTTAVAMSILYSITGIITLLFLIIIATGAVRAHRHPERYGPRNGFPGRPRQSRAKGLARAMLETLPIVKFGDPVPDKPARDIELDSANTNATNAEAAVAAGGREDGEAPRSIHAVEQEGGLGPNQAPPVASHEAEESGEENLGCSICTEDFTRGEDVRVLPCNHKYHPACIDPWLLNVSGTCPLCRVDLRPVQSNTSELPRAEDFEEPTVVAEATEADTAGMDHSTTRRHHRMSRLLDLNRLRHAAPEERIAALRRMRTQDMNQTPANEGAESTEATNQTQNNTSHEEASRRSRFSRTIRAAFDIRTTVASGSPAAPAPAAGDASMVGGRGA